MVDSEQKSVQEESSLHEVGEFTDADGTRKMLFADDVGRLFVREINSPSEFQRRSARKSAPKSQPSGTEAANTRMSLFEWVRDVIGVAFLIFATYICFAVATDYEFAEVQAPYWYKFIFFIVVWVLVMLPPAYLVSSKRFLRRLIPRLQEVRSSRVLLFWTAGIVVAFALLLILADVAMLQIGVSGPLVNQPSAN